MIDHNYAGSQNQPFPPKWIQAVCVASDTPIVSATAWNDITRETAFITDGDWQIEHFDFNVVKDLNRIFLADVPGLLDDVHELVKEFVYEHPDAFSGQSNPENETYFEEFSAFASKVSGLVKSRIPSQEKMDSLQRICRRLLVSSLIDDMWPPQKCLGVGKSLNDLAFVAWKHQIRHIDAVFAAITDKMGPGSNPEVLSDCFRSMVGIEPHMNRSNFQRKLADSVTRTMNEAPQSIDATCGDDELRSVRSGDSGQTSTESAGLDALDPQIEWDDIEPLSVHDAIPIYGDLWATAIQLTELEHSEKLLKMGSDINFGFVHFFNSEASFKNFELSRFQVGSAIADHEGLLFLSEAFLKSAKKSKRYYNDGKYRSCVHRLERAINAAKLFHRYFHLEVSGEESMAEEEFGVPYYLGYGSTESILKSVPLEAKIEILESYGNWSKYTSDVRIDTLPMLYACLLDTALRSGIIPKRCKYCGGMFFPETPNQQYCHRMNKTSGIRCDNAELRRRTPGEKPHFNNVYQNIKKKASRAASKDWQVSDYYERLARFVHDTAGPLYRNSSKVDVLVYQQWLKDVIGPKFGAVSNLSPDKRPFPVIWEGKVVEGNQPLNVNKGTESYRFLDNLQEIWGADVDVPSKRHLLDIISADGKPLISWCNDCAVLPIYYFLELLLDPKSKQIVGPEQAAKIPVPGLSESDDYTLDAARPRPLLEC